MHEITMNVIKKKALNLKDSEGRYVRRLEGRKEEGLIIISYFQK